MALRVVSRDFAAVGEVGREAGRGMPSRVRRGLGVVGVGEVELGSVCAVEDVARFSCFASHVCTVGWPQRVRVQPPRRKMRRQGRRWAMMKNEVVMKVR